jgi:hypothetical protein
MDNSVDNKDFNQ